MHVSEIKPDLMVHAKDDAQHMGDAHGEHVGTVDHLDGESYIKLKKSDSPDGQHRWIPVDWVTKVDRHAIYLDKTAEEFDRAVMTESPVSSKESA